MYTQVLVPLDGSEASERALTHAQSVAHAFGAKVHLLQVISLSHEYEAAWGGGDAHPTVIEYSLETAREITAAQQSRAERYLQDIAARLEEQGLQVAKTVRQGPIWESIADFVADNGIDLVVMSTHGRGGLQRLFIGSVTDRVIRSSHVPILAIPPED
jgi:nucleotide-binding universal stress UspA family protein